MWGRVGRFLAVSILEYKFWVRFFMVFRNNLQSLEIRLDKEDKETVRQQAIA
jgi:hypothetical protein